MATPQGQKNNKQRRAFILRFSSDRKKATQERELFEETFKASGQLTRNEFLLNLIRREARKLIGRWVMIHPPFTTFDATIHVVVADVHGREVAHCPTLEKATIVKDALNAYLNRHTRRADPITSKKAQDSSKLKLNGWREQAMSYFLEYGMMSDYKLLERFENAEVKITAARVRHIRLELQRMGLVEEKKTYTAKTPSGNDCRVFAPVNRSNTAHD
jgi:hypothetical protein